MKLLWFALLCLPWAAHADKQRLPADAPPAFQTECASCHVAFPPALLVAEDWQRVMRALDRHYGDNASLDETTRKLLEEFLVRNAGQARKLGAAGTAKAGDLPRLTQTAWFEREHRKVKATDWSSAKVKTVSNCGACHTQAGAGSYREREIVMPDGRRWKD